MTMRRTLDHLTRPRQRRKRSSQRFKLPQMWYFTDPVKTPDPAHVLSQFPKRSGIGVIIRADSLPQEKTFLAACQAAHRAHRIAGFFIRLSPWHRLPGTAAPGKREGFLGWYRTTTSPFKNNKHGERSGFVFHPITEGYSRLPSTKIDLLFITPAFVSTTHPGQAAFGHLKFMTFRHTIRRHNDAHAALGGISGHSLKRLNIKSFGAIDAFQ